MMAAVWRAMRHLSTRRRPRDRDPVDSAWLNAPAADGAGWNPLAGTLRAQRYAEGPAGVPEAARPEAARR